MKLGPLEIIVILVIVLMVFGVGKLPQVAASVGKSLKAFREGQQGDLDDDDAEEAAVTTTKKPRRRRKTAAKAKTGAAATKKTATAKPETEDVTAG